MRVSGASVNLALSAIVRPQQKYFLRSKTFTILGASFSSGVLRMRGFLTADFAWLPVVLRAQCGGPRDVGLEISCSLKCCTGHSAMEMQFRPQTRWKEDVGWSRSVGLA